MRHWNRFLARFKNVRPEGGGYVATCPAHNDSNPSASLWLDDELRIVARCRAGCTLSAILESIGSSPEELEPDPDDDIPPPVSNGSAVPETDPELARRVYAAMVDAIDLSEGHRTNLRNRGLSDDAIDRLQYRSFDHCRTDQALARLAEMFTPGDLVRVPGFVRDDTGSVQCSFITNGILVPVRNLTGAIVAFKIRRNDDENPGPKYLTLSGGGGPSAGSPVHVPMGTPNSTEVVRVTEGEIKADIAFELSGVPTISVPGVSNWRGSLEVLQAVQAKGVVVTYDADFREKPAVATAMGDFVFALSEAGYEVGAEIWNPSLGKGIDDLLAAGHQPDIIVGEELSNLLESIRQTPNTASAPATTAIAQPTNAVENPANGGASTNPLTMEGGLPAVMEFPIDVFPPPLQSFARSVSRSINCAGELVGSMMLVVAATALGNSRTLRLKHSWFEAPRIFLAIIASPGKGKSPAIKQVVAPLHAMQERMLLEYRREREAYNEGEDATEEMPTSVDQPDVPSAPSSDTAAMCAEQTASDVADPIPVPPSETTEPSVELAPTPRAKPVAKRIIVNDATMEALAVIMAENPRGIMSLNDELTGFVGGFDAYRSGRGKDRQIILSCWSGETIYVDRKKQTDAPLVVLHPFVNIAGGIQPQMLNSLKDKKGRYDGFVDRFLTCYPDSRPPAPWSAEGVPEDVARGWGQVIDTLYELQMQQPDDGGSPHPQVTSLTDAAQTAWTRWYDQHVQTAAYVDEEHALHGVELKLVAYAARLSLLIHFIRLACGEVANEEVDEESVRRGLRLTAFFESHALRTHACLDKTVDETVADKVAKWLRRRSTRRCTVRQVQRAKVAGIKKSSEAKKVLDDLVDRGRCTVETLPARNGSDIVIFKLVD